MPTASGWSIRSGIKLTQGTIEGARAYNDPLLAEKLGRPFHAGIPQGIYTQKAMTELGVVTCE